MNFCEILKYLREEKNVTQKEVAKNCNLTPTCICQLESGQRSPTGTTIKALAKYFNCSTDYLLGLEDDLGIKKTPAINYREEKLLRAFNKLEDNEKDKIIEDCEFFANLHKQKV